MTAKIVVPELSESVREARIARWLKHEGDPVTAGESLVELETEKVNVEVGAEWAGVLAKIERREGEDVRSGDVLGVIENAPVHAAGAADAPTPPPQAAVGGPVKQPKAAVAETAASSEEQASVRGPARAPAPMVTPLARRLAEEHGLDLASLAGLGSGARITKQDVEEYLTQRSTPARTVGGVRSDRREERVRMSPRRLTIARRLVEAQQTAAMLTTVNEVDMGALGELRQRHKESFLRQHGAGLGIVSFFIRAAIAALREFPGVNAEIQGEELVLKHYYDIGVAIGAEGGLIVPVLRDADRMSIVEIEKTIQSLVQKAEQRTLSLEDLRGGTFTITNGGIFGSLLSTPILNPPQAGILGLHRIIDRPVARGGQVVIRPMMYVALTYDHRIVDGREAVQFLVRVRELIEDPEVLLLEA